MGELQEVEEIHSVAGDTCMLLKVRRASSRALEALLARLYAIPGVRSTRSYVVLSTYLECTGSPRPWRRASSTLLAGVALKGGGELVRSPPPRRPAPVLLAAQGIVEEADDQVHGLNRGPG